MSMDQSLDSQTPHDQADSEDRPDEMSGRWIRDQLRDSADASPAPADEEQSAPAPAPVAQAEQVETPASVESPNDALSPIVANLARSISEAVAEPLEKFERERREESAALTESVKEQDHRITAGFAALQRVEEASHRLAERIEEQEGRARESREVVDRLQGRTEELQAEIRREVEQMTSSVGSLRSELQGFAQRLSQAEGLIAQQGASLARFETLERRRTESLSEMARLMGNVQQALDPVGAPGEEGGE